MCWARGAFVNEIRCAVCNTSNPAGSVFCGSCGTQIGFEAGEDGENRRYAAQLAQLRREIERLTGRIDRLQADLAGREEQDRAEQRSRRSR